MWEVNGDRGNALPFGTFFQSTDYMIPRLPPPTGLVLIQKLTLLPIVNQLEQMSLIRVSPAEQEFIKNGLLPPKSNVLKTLAGSTWNKVKEILAQTYKVISRPVENYAYAAPNFAQQVCDSKWSNLQRTSSFKES